MYSSPHTLLYISQKQFFNYLLEAAMKKKILFGIVAAFAIGNHGTRFCLARKQNTSVYYTSEKVKNASFSQKEKITTFAANVSFWHGMMRLLISVQDLLKLRSPYT
mmetsp:Transcript_30305/g.69444  ORF Transcript_30305/g.69444 Transcript_30305/m.69444 type:complete len:106 (-) Transcript_30305:17-334(-)